MAIAPRDIKLLWARAAGRCSAPGCPEDLTSTLAKSGDVILGEMAHIIGSRATAARNEGETGVSDGYENLILLCPNHHTLVDKAEHDYPPELLREWKAIHEERIAAVTHKKVSALGGDFEMRLWTYFNFGLILDLYATISPGGLALRSFPDLRLCGVVDKSGFPIEGSEGSSPNPRTVFESWQQGWARELQQLYSDMIEQLIHEHPPLDLDDVWGIRKLRALLYPTAVVFVNRACTFKSINDGAGHERRSVRCTAKGVQIQFEIDTWNVFSSSALTSHFRGVSRVAALLLVRSFERQSASSRSKLIVKTTPVAIGSGYAPRENRTPLIAWRKQQEHSLEDEPF